MSRPTNVGYEKYRYEYDSIAGGSFARTSPHQYEAARIKSGRIVERSPLYATEAEADDWIESHRGFDEDDYQRSRT